MRSSERLLHTSKTTATLATAALATFALLAAAPAQGKILWVPGVKDVKDQTDVSTNGELCIAVNLGPETCERVINGVHFQADRGHWNKKVLRLGAAKTNGVMYWPNFTSGGFTVKMPDWQRTDVTGIGQTKDAAYNFGLSSGRHARPGDHAIVNRIEGLTPGNTYQIQLWCAWSRTPSSGKTLNTVVEWDDGAGGREGKGGIFMTTNNTVRGQVATGIFTADSSGVQTFTCYDQAADTTKTPPLKDTWGLLNMFQLRDLTAKKGVGRVSYFGEGTPGTQTGGGRGPGLAHMYGTNCSPAISLTGHPVVGTTVNLTAENSSHKPSSAMVVLGFSPISPVPFLSGQLLVKPDFVAPVPMPWTIKVGDLFTEPHELQLPLKLPTTAATVYVQTLQLDAGAAGGVSFTPGLKIVVGS